MNLEIAIFEETLPKTFPDWMWHLWSNCGETPEARAEVIALAAHRHVRERGGWREEQPLKVFVCVLNRNRQQKAIGIDYTEFAIHRT